MSFFLFGCLIQTFISFWGPVEAVWTSQIFPYKYTFIPLSISMYSNNRYHKLETNSQKESIIEPYRRVEEKADSRSPSLKLEDMKMESSTVGGSKRRFSCKGFCEFFKEVRGRLYILKRCIVMLLCRSD